MTLSEYCFLSALHRAGGVASPFKSAELPVSTREQDKARRNLKKNGLVEYKDKKWHLTDAGLDALVTERNARVAAC